MSQGKRLVVNVDISHSCFWHEASLVQLGFQMSGKRSQDEFVQSCTPRSNGTPGPGMQLLKRLQKNNFIVRHRGQIPGSGEFSHILNPKICHERKLNVAQSPKSGISSVSHLRTRSPISSRCSKKRPIRSTQPMSSITIKRSTMYELTNGNCLFWRPTSEASSSRWNWRSWHLLKSIPTSSMRSRYGRLHASQEYH